MDLIVAVNKTYHSYFDLKYQGTLNPNKQFKPISNLKDSSKKNKHQIYEHNKEEHTSRKAFIAKDIMSDTLWSLSSTDTIKDAFAKMKKLAVHHLIVEEGNELVGLVSDRDLLKNSNTPDKKIMEVMSKNVLMCKEDTRIPLIAKVMLEEQVSSILVTNDEYIRKGIITRSDLLDFIVRNVSVRDWA